VSIELNKRYREELMGLSHRMQEIISDTEKAGEWSAEQRTNFDAASGRATELEHKITELEADLARSARLTELNSVDYGKVLRAGSISETPEDNSEKRAAEYERTFGSYIRNGLDNLSGEQRQLLLENRAVGPGQVTATNTAGGYLIPPGYRAVMTEAMVAFGGLYNHANVITTSTGNPLQWPSNDDTSNVGAILEEANVVPAGSATIGTNTIGAYMYTSKLVLVSLQLLQDSAFDLDTWLPRKLGQRLGRAQSTHFITGNGTTQPEGIATNSTNGVTAASAALTYDNLIDLEHSVDPAYRASGTCRFLFNDSTLGVLRKLKDTQGRPLWLPVPVPGMPATINGVQYTIDQGVASVAATNKSVFFGDFHAGYIVRQVLDMQMARLSERYADLLQVGFFGFTRLDAKKDDPRAVRSLVHSAT